MTLRLRFDGTTIELEDDEDPPDQEDHEEAEQEVEQEPPSRPS